MAKTIRKGFGRTVADTNPTISTGGIYNHTQLGSDAKNPYMMGHNLRKFDDFTQYDLYKGVTDFTKMEQFAQFESGYPFLFVVSTPNFMNKLADSNSYEGLPNTLGGIDGKEIAEYYRLLTSNFKHIVEAEFKGLSGLDGLSTDTTDISDGIQSINLITKVNKQAATTVSMSYVEKIGSPLSRYAKTYLTGIKDPATQIKHYHGLIHHGKLGENENPGPHQEVFSFLYFVTDNTGRRLEQAYLLAGAQLTGTQEGDLYGAAKGDIDKKEISLEFNCIPLQSEYIDEMAQRVINRMNTVSDGNNLYREFNSYRFRYKGATDVLDKIVRPSNGEGASI